MVLSRRGVQRITSNFRNKKVSSNLAMNVVRCLESTSHLLVLRVTVSPRRVASRRKYHNWIQRTPILVSVGCRDVTRTRCVLTRWIAAKHSWKCWLLKLYWTLCHGLCLSFSFKIRENWIYCENVHFGSGFIRALLLIWYIFQMENI